MATCMLFPLKANLRRGAALTISRQIFTSDHTSTYNYHSFSMYQEALSVENGGAILCFLSVSLPRRQSLAHSNFNFIIPVVLFYVF